MRFFSKSLSLKRGVSVPRGSVRTVDLIDIALKNLFYKRLRTSLTIMGVMIGVGAVIFLLAFGLGLRNVVKDQVVDSNSIRTVDVTTIKSQLVQLNDGTIQTIKDMQGVNDVARIYNEAGTTSYKNSKIEAVLYGADQTYMNALDYKRVSGDQPTFKNASDVFVNSSYVKAIGVTSPGDVVGKPITVTFKLKKLADSTKTNPDTVQSFTGTIKGVLNTGSGAEIYIASSNFTDIGAVNASQVKVLTDRKDDVPGLRKKIEALGLVTNSPLETLDQINQVFGFLNLLFLGFGSVGLIIAILGMFNTLTISLLERTKEIGLMITLGARKKDIRRLFIVEAVGLSFFGGLAGITGAYAVSRVVDYILNHFARSRGVTQTFTVFSFQAYLLFATVLFSIVLGLLVVYIPAKRAAETNPIEALKN